MELSWGMEHLYEHGHAYTHTHTLHSRLKHTYIVERTPINAILTGLFGHDLPPFIIRLSTL